MINLTQHCATPEQIAVGVIEPKDKATIQRLLTFDTLPDRAELQERANTIAAIASQEGAQSAMIGGAPFFMSELETSLVISGIAPFYAFSVRDSIEQLQPDGSVKKVQTFKHVGFVAGSTLPKGNGD